MNPDLHRDVAASLDAEPALLPYLPELLADLTALGGSPREVVELIRPLALPPGSRALDLGCGKGAIAVALAEELEFDVWGVDAFAPFVDEARSEASRRGLTSCCHFRQADLRAALDEAGDFDLLLLIAMGPVLGELGRSVGTLRRRVRRDGFMIIDDGFLADGMTGRVPGYEDYAEHDETIRRLTSHGDSLVREFLPSPEATARVNQSNTLAIAEKNAHLAEALRRYVAEQERESRLLEVEVVPALWLLRRGP